MKTEIKNDKKDDKRKNSTLSAIPTSQILTLSRFLLCAGTIPKLNRAR